MRPKAARSQRRDFKNLKAGHRPVPVIGRGGTHHFTLY